MDSKNKLFVSLEYWRRLRILVATMMIELVDSKEHILTSIIQVDTVISGFTLCFF